MFEDGGAKMNEANYFRPKTRGELKEKLRSGIPCEVVSSNVSITSLLLRGWLEFDGFTVRPSENEHWSVFEPKLNLPS